MKNIYQDRGFGESRSEIKSCIPKMATLRANSALKIVLTSYPEGSAEEKRNHEKRVNPMGTAARNFQTATSFLKDLSGEKLSLFKKNQIVVSYSF